MSTNSPSEISRGPRRAAGFTLLEILVAITVVVLATAVALPAFRSDGGVGLRGAAETVAAGLRRARERAQNTNEPATLDIDLDTRRFEVPGAGLTRTLSSDVEVALVTARSERTGERSGRIRFFPDGSSTGGRITVSRDGTEILVDVDWLTGRVRQLDAAGDDVVDTDPGGRVTLR